MYLHMYAKYLYVHNLSLLHRKLKLCSLIIAHLNIKCFFITLYNHLLKNITKVKFYIFIYLLKIIDFMGFIFLISPIL